MCFRDTKSCIEDFLKQAGVWGLWLACAEVDNICGENGVPVPEMDAIVLKWLGGKNLED